MNMNGKNKISSLKMTSLLSYSKGKWHHFTQFLVISKFSSLSTSVRFCSFKKCPWVIFHILDK